MKEFISIFFFARSVWFLIVLFISEVLCIVLWYLVPKVGIRYVLLVSIWLVVCLSPVHNLLYIYKFKWLFPFMILGMLCEEYAVYEKFGNRIYIQPLGFLFIPIALLIYRAQPFEEWISSSYSSVKNIAIGGLYYLCSILSVILILWISAILSRKRCGRYIAMAGRSSLEIYVMHMLMVKFLPVVPAGVMDNNTLIYLYFSMYAMVLTVCIVLLSKYIFERFRILRWMVGK